MRFLAPFALIVAVLAAVIWLDDTPADADLVFVNRNEIFTLDPQRMSYLQDLRLAHLLYEGLLRWDTRDFSILPAAADLPAVSEDRRVYTFHIRPRACWSNGEPLTAHDFIYAWSRACLPDTAADYSSLFFLIDGAEDFFTWRQMQTHAFSADPWRDASEPDPAAARAAAGRLRRLLDATDLPAAVRERMPPAALRPTIRAEIARLEAAADAGGATLAVELASLTACRVWFDHLRDSRSRAAEALWMWNAAERRFREQVGLTALDDRTLVVRLRQPTAYFTDLLCFGVFFPVHRPTVEGWPRGRAVPPEGWHAMEPPPFSERRWVRLGATTGKLEQRHGWARPAYHVGNGTHVLSTWRYKRDVRLERNPRFHEPERVKCNSILALTIEDTNTAVLAFESGRVDWLSDVSAEYAADMIAQRRRYETHYAEELRSLQSQGLSIGDALAALPPPGPGERRNIHVFPTFATDFYSFNCRPRLPDGGLNPFADAAVRRAFCLAVDRETIVERVTRLHEPVTSTLIPPGSIPGYHSPTGLGYDPGAARRELAAAGWADGNDDGLVENADDEPFPVIDLLYTTDSPRYKWISLSLKSQWESELGVRVELRPTETKFYKEDLKVGNFMIARGGWYGDYGDPTTFLDLCRSTDGNNDRKYASAYVDDLLDAAEVEHDPGKRMRILEACEAHLFGADEPDVPMLVLCQLVQVYMYEPGRVHGLSDHPRLVQHLWQMKVTRP